MRRVADELSGIVVKSTDPRADAIARLATLFGGNGAKVREIVAALDPIVLPLFLEFGSIVFFAVAFPHRRRVQPAATEHNHEQPITVAARVYTQGEALRDFRKLRAVGPQQFLAERYGVDKSTVSRWLQAWEPERAIGFARVTVCSTISG